MVTEVPTKLRLVRCPKCRKVLPELPNVPVYQCGGCGTILQAKRRKNIVKDTELLNHETDRSEKIQLDHSSEDRDPHRSIQEESSSVGAHILNQSNGTDQSEIKEKNTKQPEEAHISGEHTQELACHAKEEGTGYGGARLSDGAASSIELDHQHESVESSPEAETHNVMNENMDSSPRGLNINSNEVLSTEVDHEVSEVPLRQMGGRRDEEVDDYRSGKQPEDVSFSNEVASSSEFNHHLSERSSIDAKSFDEEDENQDYVDESKADNENDLGSVKFSGELSCSADNVDGVTNAREQCSLRDEDNNQYLNQKQPEFVSFPDEVASSAELKNHLVRNKVSNEIDSGGTMISSGDLSSSNEHISQHVEELSPATGPNIEMNLEVKSPISSEKSWSDEKFLSGSRRNSMGHNRFSGESFLTDGFISPHNEHMEHDQNLLSRSPGHSMAHRFSGESFLTDGFVSPRDEHMAQYHNRAHDGHEGVVDLALPKSRTAAINYAYEGSVSSYDEDDDPFSLRKVHLSRRKLKEAEMKSDEGVDKVRSGFPDRKSSPLSPEYNRFAAKSSQLRLAELEKLAKNALPVRNRMKFKPDEGLSKAPSYSKSHRAGYESRKHLNYASDDFSRPSKRPEDLEEEKIELLKMVYDLQKELKRTQISSGTARFSGDHAASEVGLFRSAFSCNQGRRPYQSRDSRVPFSAEATTQRRQDGGGSYCVHCCPQEWRLQPLLPPHSCCYKSQSLFHSGRRSYNLHHHSGGSTPQRYQNSELSDDHWFMDHETRRIHQEKKMAKKHVRPIVGGAPLVACYKCSELLQMPADFLHSKRKKLHRLQCGSCSAVLKFSLHGGTNIVPYEVYAAGDDDVNAAVAPPPSEVDGFSKFASPSRATERDPSSGDYGPPVSYSTEAEPSNVDRQNGRKNRSGETKEEGLLKGLGKKIYNSAGGFSSKMSKTKRMMSSDIQEASSSGSPLHKLMGYSSPSKVIER